MSKFKEKRSDLERFIKEQIIGPGAYNKRFHFKSNFNRDYYQEDLESKESISDFNEIITEVPAYFYSSAILFPKAVEKNLNSSEKNEQEKDNNNDHYESLNQKDSSSLDDDNLSTDFSENLISKQQNYPNQFGISFVVNSDFNIEDLDLQLSYRVYQSINKKELLSKGFSIYIPEYKEEISKIMEIYFTDYFETNKINKNYFITIKKAIEGDDFYEIDYNYLNNYVSKELIPRLDKIIKDLKIESTQFYKTEDKVYNDKTYQNVYVIYVESIIEYLKQSLSKNIQNLMYIKDLISLIEIYSQLKDVLEHFKSIFRKRNPLPVWESYYYNDKLNLPKFDLNGSKIQRHPPKSFSNAFPNLKMATQYLRDNTNKDKVYVKLIVSNEKTVKIKNNESTWLNKKDEVNREAFFGIKLDVSERVQGILQEYNPLQLLNIDEEDNFNKLIYRNFKDYGEGYNTSVDWGHKNGLKYVSTEFLPEQETPNVDYIPSKVENGKVTPRIKDDSFLSFTWLSTLSGIEDSLVIEKLNYFVDNYLDWINEKRKDIDTPLLRSQLSACKADYKRLKRNIQLLQDSKEAMIAFRVMNTAMFMQLHNGILIKRNSSDLNSKLNEQYYKKQKLETDYKWRSFQLAFILLNIDAFVKPKDDDNTVKDVFGSDWPERNEIADLVWFPTGGGKTEAYLGIIAFCIALRRFTKRESGYGTTVLMRYTLRLLTLQQFQRATLLICAMEVIRKDNFKIPNNLSLGNERITIGLFVGSGSLPNNWLGNEGMQNELQEISRQFTDNVGNPSHDIKSNLPFNNCPWCGSSLFESQELNNIHPHIDQNEDTNLGINDRLIISCNNPECSFHSDEDLLGDEDEMGLPLILFDEDIYKFPPTLLFGTVDKFATLANKVSTETGKRNEDSRRLLGKGYEHDTLPPELIIQDELHLLLGPLGTAVGLFEKGIDELCTYTDGNNKIIKPKIITSTATTRNTDQQIFALFNRRSEIFPKQGVTADDSFFAYYKRLSEHNYISNRKYMGILPIGKTQVWMQLRIASIALAHRLKYVKDNLSLEQLLGENDYSSVLDYYHTVLSYFNSLKEVGKTQSQLNHYLPGDLNYVIKNTMPWSFIDKIIRKESEIIESELTGRLSGEEVKTNLKQIEQRWELTSLNPQTENISLNRNIVPEFIISTNMISVGIDVSRFNTMIISSMPRNIAEYIQASSRVARNKEGIVFTVHHPFRSRDISHYQKFKEFHEKFYSYVEPISVTPFATKALDRYLAMLVATIIRHDPGLGLENNNSPSNLSEENKEDIKNKVITIFSEIKRNSDSLNQYLKSNEKLGVKSNVEGIIDNDTIEEIELKLIDLLNKWDKRIEELEDRNNLKYRVRDNLNNSLFISNTQNTFPNHWKVGDSLREIDPITVIKTVQQ